MIQGGRYHRQAGNHFNPYDYDDIKTIADHAHYSKVVHAAFAQRRKTLRNGLKGLLTAEAIAALGIDPGTRAEQLPLEDFVRLADAAWKAAGPSRING